MSKIAEQKALEAYPISISKDSVEEGFDWNEEYREAFIKGYDQAMQDFLDMACEWLDNFLYIESYHDEEREDKIEDFKNYMQDESEN